MRELMFEIGKGVYNLSNLLSSCGKTVPYLLNSRKHELSEVQQQNIS